MHELLGWALFALGGGGGWAVWQFLAEHRTDLAERERRHLSSRGLSIVLGMRPALYDTTGRRILPLLYVFVAIQVAGFYVLFTTL